MYNTCLKKTFRKVMKCRVGLGSEVEIGDSIKHNTQKLVVKSLRRNNETINSVEDPLVLLNT